MVCLEIKKHYPAAEKNGDFRRKLDCGAGKNFLEKTFLKNNKLSTPHKNKQSSVHTHSAQDAVSQTLERSVLSVIYEVAFLSLVDLCFCILMLESERIRNFM